MEEIKKGIQTHFFTDPKQTHIVRNEISSPHAEFVFISVFGVDKVSKKKNFIYTHSMISEEESESEGDGLRI